MLRPARHFLRHRPRGVRLPSALLAALLAVTVLVQGTDAQRAWCKTDPIVVIDGATADVFVSAPLGSMVQALLTVTGPNQIVVTVPQGVNAWLLLTDVGFGRGNVLTFAQSSDLHETAGGIEVRVQVFVPATGSFPVRVEFAPRLLGLLWPASAEGTTNSWITLTTTF